MTLPTVNGQLVGDELAFGTAGQGIPQDSPDLERIMSEDRMTIVLPPFAATFQLTGSRAAICDVMSKCGASVPGCARYKPAPAYIPSRPTTPSCSGGRDFDTATSRCTYPRNAPVWIGSQCKKCGQNYEFRNGRCILKQNCGPNAHRNVEGDCHCNKNYEMHNGRCRRKIDKKSGFEIATWQKPQCKGLDAACKRGNGKACMRYEEVCQVN